MLGCVEGGVLVLAGGVGGVLVLLSGRREDILEKAGPREVVTGIGVLHLVGQQV